MVQAEGFTLVTKYNYIKFHKFTIASRGMSSYLPRYYVITWSKCYGLKSRSHRKFVFLPQKQNKSRKLMSLSERTLAQKHRRSRDHGI